MTTQPSPSQIRPPLRPFAPADFPAICELDALCFPEGIAYPPEEIAYFLSQRGAICLVAEQAGRVVAWILGQARRTRVGHIITIDVHPVHRRRGFGDALMATLEQEFQQAGCATVRLEVAVNNTGAQAFYERRGYLVKRTLRNYYADGGDAYMMELALSAPALSAPRP
jgi:ribosomal-protein-alanine acetyltransferase